MVGIFRANFLALAAAIVVAGLCMFPSTALFKTRTSPLADKELERFQYCGSDSDCVAVQNGCCDCANGGRDAAIAREAEPEFKALFDCNKVACTEKAAQPQDRLRCRSGVVSCVQHRCQYFSPGQFEQSQANIEPQPNLEPAQLGN